LHRRKFIQAICGPFLDLETSFSLKGFFLSFGCSNFNYYESATKTNHDFRAFYFLSKTLASFENLGNVFFFGTNPRLEVPLLNVRLRKSFLAFPSAKYYSLGLAIDNLNYPVKSLGNSMSSMLKFFEGKLPLNFIIFLSEYSNLNFLSLSAVKKTHFFLGSSLLSRLDLQTCLNGFFCVLRTLELNLSSLNVVSKFLGRLSAFETGNLPSVRSSKGPFKHRNFLFLCGVDFEGSKLSDFQLKNFTVYQGSFYINNFVQYLNLILPSCAFTEKFSSFLNLEGRLRFTQKAVAPFKSAFSD